MELALPGSQSATVGLVGSPLAPSVDGSQSCLEACHLLPRAAASLLVHSLLLLS